MLVDYEDKQLKYDTSLQVAMNLQKAFNHKPYQQIFSAMGASSLDDQLKLIFVAVETENPGFATFEQFKGYALKKWGLNKVGELVGEIMEGCTFHGMSEQEVAAKKSQLRKLQKEAQNH